MKKKVTNSIYLGYTMNNKLYIEYSHVYCSGQSLGDNTDWARAGFGVYFTGQEQPQHISDRLRGEDQSKQRAEIMAALMALDMIWIKLNRKNSKLNYTLKTDSVLVIKLLVDGYNMYPDFEEWGCIPNRDLIIPMIEKYVKIKDFYEMNKVWFANNGQFKIQWAKKYEEEVGTEKARDLAQYGAHKKKRRLSVDFFSFRNFL